VANPFKGLRPSAGTKEPAAVTNEATDVSPPPRGPAHAPSFLDRVPLRRRMQYLRRRRELALRDLGGFVFEEHHQGEDRADLRTEKLDALDALEGELHTIEQALDDRRELLILREPGIASCPHCATIHGSEANFCPNCGVATATASGAAEATQASGR
jgi:hypothetical protein